MAEDWKQLAAEEKDPEKVRLLLDKLIEALGAGAEAGSRGNQETSGSLR